MKRLALHWQIFVSLLLACGVGLAVDGAGQTGQALTAGSQFVGRLFLRALTMLVVPLIAASIISGVAELGKGAGLARLGFKTAAYYLATSLVSVVVGLVAVNAFTPGYIGGRPARAVLGLDDAGEGISAQVGERDLSDLLGVFERMIPRNVVSDAAEGQMLGVIFFSLLFGYAMARLPEEQGRVLRAFWRGVNAIMLRITGWVMRWAPVGVFALVMPVVVESGLEAFATLAMFVACVLSALLVHGLVVLPLVVSLVGRVSPWGYLRAMAPALMMAFSTSSSAATLPLTMGRVRSAGVSERVSGFTLPLGATVNMDGTALYECVAAIFVAQSYGVELGIVGQFTVVVVALVSSIGVAGVPSASLVAIALILTSVGLPLEGAALILAVDRLLDMCRTTINVWSDSCAAVVIASSEGERKGLLKHGRESL